MSNFLESADSPNSRSSSPDFISGSDCENSFCNSEATFSAKKLLNPLFSKLPLSSRKVILNDNVACLSPRVENPSTCRKGDENPNQQLASFKKIIKRKLNLSDKEEEFDYNNDFHSLPSEINNMEKNKGTELANSYLNQTGDSEVQKIFENSQSKTGDVSEIDCSILNSLERSQIFEGVTGGLAPKENICRNSKTSISDPFSDEDIQTPRKKNYILISSSEDEEDLERKGPDSDPGLTSPKELQYLESNRKVSAEKFELTHSSNENSDAEVSKLFSDSDLEIVTPRKKNYIIVSSSEDEEYLDKKVGNKLAVSETNDFIESPNVASENSRSTPSELNGPGTFTDAGFKFESREEVNSEKVILSPTRSNSDNLDAEVSSHFSDSDLDIVTPRKKNYATVILSSDEEENSQIEVTPPHSPEDLSDGDWENEYGSPYPRRLSVTDVNNMSIEWPLGKNPEEPKKLSFISSLWGDPGVPGFILDPEASKFLAAYETNKVQLTDKLFHLFNKEAFSSRLPSNLNIDWSKRLTKTAGYAKNKINRMKERESSITLSVKILVKPCQLVMTLIHELCHSAAWIVHGQRGHGRVWRYWTDQARDVFPELPPITVCHKYDTVGCYIYKCTLCGHKYGKNVAIDVELVRCHHCVLRGKYKCIKRP